MRRVSALPASATSTGNDGKGKAGYTADEIDVLVVHIGPRNVWSVHPVELFVACKNLRVYPDIACKCARWESYREAWQVMGGSLVRAQADDIRNLPGCFWMVGAFAGCYVVASVRACQDARSRKVTAMVKPIFCCCLLLTLGAWGQAVRDKDDPQAAKLGVLEHLWNDAQVNRDERVLEGMIADTFVDTEWDGEISERGKFLADIKDPRFKPTLVTIQDLKVNLYHNTGIVTGVYHTKGSYYGKPYDHRGRFTDTWIFEDGKWECVASHTSLLKK